MTIKDLANSKPAEKMPVLFIGHGSPMNAIADNAYSRKWKEIGKELAAPKAILCISAHWLTRGTSVTLSEHPKTIHDFGGFPEELFQQQYRAPGAPEFAKLTIEHVKSITIHEDYEWGLDHGAWSVLKNMYPKADIPVYQMSIDYYKPTEYHYNLGKELSFLREKGVLIVASGNVVHNLGMIQWDEDSKPYDWAIEFDEIVKKSIEQNDVKPLINYTDLGRIATLAHPTNDHYLPLMYALALRTRNDSFRFFNDSIDLSSLSMRSVIFS